MRERRSGDEDERAPYGREFGVFVAGASGRLLHAATLLTAETRTHNPYAQALLTASLAHTYAVWGRLREEDPYELTRRALATRFARTAWRHHGGPGVLGALHPQERLVVVLRLYEGVAEEQLAALLGVPEARVRAVCARAVATLRAAARGTGPAGRAA
ncbi:MULTISPECIES: sigma factor-like helix-turn-helix DNA-binding protein [unclassified Streptomyces]|uniref:sigma factor-like helix-turn-helix DNA-binding protein n=1 Tax=unclassified Streptomyces TaxID=2593676 RepID=UPI0016617E0E|nr:MULTISPECIES: sigma factor-like helix-turn-helix DNA-binding protein [unclassified Streptomyces]